MLPRLRTLVLAVFALCGCATVRPPADLAISDIWVHDGEAPAFRATVTVRDGRIERVGGAAFARKVVKGRGLHLVPGLIDMHVHVAAEAGNLVPGPAYLSHGITTVRDLGGFPDQVQRAIAADRPHIKSAIQTMNGEAMADFHVVVKTETEVRTAVNRLADQGANVIKIHRAFRPELLGTAVEEARARNLKVTGHIPLGLHPLRACELGMGGIEHIGSFIEAYVSVSPGRNQQEAIDYLLSDASEPLYRCLAERKVTVTPTLVLYQSLARARSGEGPIRAEFRKFIAEAQAITRRMHRSGVVLLAGSDSSGLKRPAISPGTSLLDELELLEAAGLNGHEILKIGGLNAAVALGIVFNGRLIAPKLPADFLILLDDPRRDASAFRRPHSIYFGGQPVTLRPGSN